MTEVREAAPRDARRRREEKKAKQFMTGFNSRIRSVA